MTVDGLMSAAPPGWSFRYWPGMIAVPTRNPSRSRRGGSLDVAGSIEVENERLTERPKSSWKKARLLRVALLLGRTAGERREATSRCGPWFTLWRPTHLRSRSRHGGSCSPPLLSTTSEPPPKSSASTSMDGAWRTLFRSLKTGYKTRFRLSRTADRLQRAIAINAVIAWRTMIMTLLGRQVPECEAELMFTDHEFAFPSDYAAQAGLDPPESLGRSVQRVAHLRNCASLDFVHADGTSGQEVAP